MPIAPLVLRPVLPLADPASVGRLGAVLSDLAAVRALIDLAETWPAFAFSFVAGEWLAALAATDRRAIERLRGLVDGERAEALLPLTGDGPGEAVLRRAWSRMRLVTECVGRAPEAAWIAPGAEGPPIAPALLLALGLRRVVAVRSSSGPRRSARSWFEPVAAANWAPEAVLGGGLPPGTRAGADRLWLLAPEAIDARTLARLTEVRGKPSGRGARIIWACAPAGTPLPSRPPPGPPGEAEPLADELVRAEWADTLLSAALGRPARSPAAAAGWIAAGPAAGPLLGRPLLEQAFAELAAEVDTRPSSPEPKAQPWLLWNLLPADSVARLELPDHLGSATALLPDGSPCAVAPVRRRGRGQGHLRVAELAVPSLGWTVVTFVPGADAQPVRSSRPIELLPVGPGLLAAPVPARAGPLPALGSFGRLEPAGLHALAFHPCADSPDLLLRLQSGLKRSGDAVLEFLGSSLVLRGLSPGAISTWRLTRDGMSWSARPADAIDG